MWDLQGSIPTAAAAALSCRSNAAACFLELASIASGRPLEDAEEDERTAEEEDAAAAAEEPQMLRP